MIAAKKFVGRRARGGEKIGDHFICEVGKDQNLQSGDRYIKDDEDDSRAFAYTWNIFFLLLCSSCVEITVTMQ